MCVNTPCLLLSDKHVKYVPGLVAAIYYTIPSSHPPVTRQHHTNMPPASPASQTQSNQLYENIYKQFLTNFMGDATFCRIVLNCYYIYYRLDSM